MLKGLKSLILERFHPGSYLPMIFVFTLMNGLFPSFLQQGNPSVTSFILTAFLMLSAFLRLRLFDEIKDYDTDLKINPQRPLARGAITIPQVKKLILICLLIEALICLSLGTQVLIVHSFAVLYSLLMYEEFFIGDLLRPHLTTYAITHTFVSVLLGLSAATAMTQWNVNNLSPAILTFFLINWVYFNLFEFARKTYAREEERQGVDSYSSLFKPKGAALLSLSQVILGLTLLINVFQEKNTLPFFFLAGLYLVLTLAYALKPTVKTAKAFRNLSGLFLIVQYTFIIWFLWR